MTRLVAVQACPVSPNPAIATSLATGQVGIRQYQRRILGTHFQLAPDHAGGHRWYSWSSYRPGPSETQGLHGGIGRHLGTESAAVACDDIEHAGEAIRLRAAPGPAPRSWRERATRA